MSGTVSNKEYDCLLIYNHARSRLSRIEDNELSLSVVERADQLLTTWGYRKNHYYDRDCIPGRNVFNELFRVVDSSQFVLLILTRGFLNNCWIRYCQMAAFKRLIDESTCPERIASHRLIPILINISENDIPKELGELTYICFTNDWDTNEEEWKKLKNALDGHPMQETTQRGIGSDIPPSTGQHISQGIPESSNTPALPSDTRASATNNASSSRSTRTAIVTPNSSGNFNAQSDLSRLSSEDSIDSMNSFSSSLLFPPHSLATSTNSSLAAGRSAAQHVPLLQQSNQNQNSIPQRQNDDLVTLSGHGSFSSQQPHQPLGRYTRARLSETNRPITHTSSIQGDTSIDGSSSISHSFTEDEDNTLAKETVASQGSLRLQSTDLEPDAQQSMSPTEAAAVQQSVASSQNHSPNLRLSQSMSNTGIELDSPELGPLNVTSLLDADMAPESSPLSNQINFSDTLSYEPDTAVTQSQEVPNREERESPSLLFRAVHLSLHAILTPDKVYVPP